MLLTSNVIRFHFEVIMIDRVIHKVQTALLVASFFGAGAASAFANSASGPCQFSPVRLSPKRRSGGSVFCPSICPNAIIGKVTYFPPCRARVILG